MSRARHTNELAIYLKAAVLAGLFVITVLFVGMGPARAEDPEDPPSSSTTAVPTSSTAPPTTTTLPTTTTTQRTTTTARVTTTIRPATTTTASTTTTTEETTTTTRHTTTTEHTGTTVGPAVITPPTSDTTGGGSGEGSGGGMSNGFKVAAIVGGLGVVGISIAGLTFAYWRHTRPVQYMDALDVLGESSPAGGGAAAWTAVVDEIVPATAQPGTRAVPSTQAPSNAPSAEKLPSDSEAHASLLSPTGDGGKHVDSPRIDDAIVNAALFGVEPASDTAAPGNSMENKIASGLISGHRATDSLGRGEDDLFEQRAEELQIVTLEDLAGGAVDSESARPAHFEQSRSVNGEDVPVVRGDEPPWTESGDMVIPLDFKSSVEVSDQVDRVFSIAPDPTEEPTEGLPSGSGD